MSRELNAKIESLDMATVERDAQNGNMAAEDIVKWLPIYRESPNDPGVKMMLVPAIDEYLQQ